MSLSVRSRR